jgi:hypothetical protein
MAWLGEEIAPAVAGALAPRCVKDLIEERLFERRRDLFSDLSLVFMDATSLSFYGAVGLQPTGLMTRAARAWALMATPRTIAPT